MRSIIAALTSVLVLSLLGGCSSRVATSPVPAVRKTAASLITSLTPRPGIRYYQQGVHAAGETSVGVGILRYRSLDATRGEWLLTSYEGNTLLAADVRPFAVVAVEPRFEAVLHRLDGQNVAVEGPVVSARNGVSRIGATALRQVSDMFPRDTNVISRPGFYNDPMGMNLVIGWTGETTNGVTTLYDRAPDSTQTPRAIARVIGAQRPGPQDRVMDAEVFVIKSGPVPLVEVVDGSSWSPRFYTTQVGSPPEWTRMECAGVKDRPNSRTRVVGELVREPRGPRADRLCLSVPAAPWGIRHVLGERARVVLDDPNGLVAAGLRYGIFAAEGKLTPYGYIYRLKVEKFEDVPQP
jgi:hypothetical protein